MKKVILQLVVINLVLGAFLFLPLPLHAQQQEVNQGLTGLSSIFGSGAGTRSRSVPELLAYIIKILLVLSGIIAILFVIIGGYQYITSGGNAETATKGQRTVTNAVIGIVIIILSYVIVNAVVNTISRNNP